MEKQNRGFPGTKALATGSSTLQASAKFQDTLTGRKSEIWLTPMVSADLKDFGNDDLKHRFLFGGLPPFWLSDEVPVTAGLRPRSNANGRPPTLIRRTCGLSESFIHKG